MAKNEVKEVAKEEEKTNIIEDTKEEKTEEEEVMKKEEKAEEKEEIKKEEEVESKTTETKEEEVPERVYTIPLRDAYNQPWSKRSRKAVRIVKEFLSRHTKRDIKLGGDVNQEIWKRGMKHPPRRIRVRVKGDVANLMK